jgi:hypothetical protein
MTDEELFGAEVCAQLDVFADAAPELTDAQVALLAPLFASELEPGRAAA